MSNANNDQDPETDPESVSRRRVLASAAGLAAAGAAGFYTGAETASADPSAVYPVSGEDPLLKVRADRIQYIPRSSDPSSPAGGTTWVVD
jgi:hypothetical protein